MAVAVNLDAGPRWTLGPRDAPHPLGRVAGRLKRALDNQLEALVVFTAAVAVVVLADASTPFSRLMATVFLAARLLYVPAYVVHVWGLRSTVWAVGFGASVAMPLAVLVFHRPA